MTCTFQKAWQGTCGAKVEGNRCDEHKNLVCSSCGAPATKQCDETQGPCVCGVPICDACEHEIAPNGTNKGSTHIRKGTQRYKPWYQQDESLRIHGEYLMFKRDLESIERLARSIGGEEGETYRNEWRSKVLSCIAAMEIEYPVLCGETE